MATTLRPKNSSITMAHNMYYPAIFPSKPFPVFPFLPTFLSHQFLSYQKFITRWLNLLSGQLSGTYWCWFYNPAQGKFAPGNATRTSSRTHPHKQQFAARSAAPTRCTLTTLARFPHRQPRRKNNQRAAERFAGAHHFCGVLWMSTHHHHIITHFVRSY